MIKREISDSRRVQLEELSEKLGVKFNDISLLDKALTHTSYANEVYGKKKLWDNERLEFMGDAVLETVVSSYLFDKYPNRPEGELTKMRSATVCEATLSKKGIELGFCDYILLGKGEQRSGGAMRSSNMEDAFEAVIGAVFKDQGWEVAQEYVLRQLQDELNLLQKGKVHNDYKTALQELIQYQQQDNTIEYIVLRADGPDHAKVFEIAVLVDGQQMGIGIGHSKKAAEQQAAQNALNELKTLKKR